MWYFVESGLRLGILFDYVFFNSDTCETARLGSIPKGIGIDEFDSTPIPEWKRELKYLERKIIGVRIANETI